MARTGAFVWVPVVGMMFAIAAAGCGGGASGGGSGGTPGTGGASPPATGGSTTSSGGAPGSGGAPSSGGSSGSGGAASGGAPGSGGGPGSGGSASGGGGGSTGGASGSGTGGRGSSSATGGGSPSGGAGGGAGNGSSAFKLTSSTLMDGAAFPQSATCEATTASSQMPALMWTGAPANTKSFAMVFIDITLTNATPPNANGFHSAMWDIPATVTMLPMGLPAGSPPMGVAGLESVKQKKAPSGMAYLGPCPNFGTTMRTKTDTYNFRLYALSVETLPSNFASMSIQQMYNALEAMQALGVAVLAGTSNAAGTSLK